LKRRRGQSLALLTVVFGYVGGASGFEKSGPIDIVVAESGDFPGRSNSSLNSKPCASDGSGNGSFQGGEIFATTNQFIRLDANNRVGVTLLKL
jgi:hypothetical protein